jgi:hypothetical protein
MWYLVTLRNLGKVWSTFCVGAFIRHVLYVRDISFLETWSLVGCLRWLVYMATELHPELCACALRRDSEPV